MGKGDRKTQAKRNRAKMELPTIAPAPRKPKAKKQGRARMVEIKAEREDDAKRTVLAGRARQMGKDPHSREDRAAMDRQSHGEAAGRAISLSHGGDKGERLQQAYRGLTAAEQRYNRIVLGQSIHAKCAKVEMMPERLTTSAEDAPPDLRSDDEKHRAAVNEWMRWKGYTQSLSAAHRTALFNASRGLVELHVGPELTRHGRAFVAAVEALADMVDRKPR